MEEYLFFKVWRQLACKILNLHFKVLLRIILLQELLDLLKQRWVRVIIVLKNFRDFGYLVEVFKGFKMVLQIILVIIFTNHC